MKKGVLAAIGAVSLLGITTSSNAANTRCWWTGYYWACPGGRYYHHADRSQGRPYGFYYNSRQYFASHLGPEPGGGFYHGEFKPGKTD